jgi:protein-L-isoaspartate(D-aspartate) O-methyltransferase
MTTDLDAYRRFFAEDIQICGNLRTTALVDALASVPRERFLPPGPWVIRGEADFQSPPRKTPSDDPRFIYHNIAVAIDQTRMLFNGAPSLVGACIDALALESGHRVMHVGGGTGYYSSLIAHVVGAAGAVTVVEVDEGLARQAAANLADRPWVTVRHGDGRGITDGPFNAIIVNAGVTHPEPEWLSSLAPGGRLVLPLTAAFGAPSAGAGAAPSVGAAVAFGSTMPTISKGLMVLVTRVGDTDHYSARVVTFVAIYSAVGLRDEAANAELGRAMSRMPIPPLRRFRTDAHEADATCWCHTARGCWSTAE